METRTYKVYKFDELPADSQRKAIEENRYINVEDEMWNNPDSVYELKRELERLGYEDVKVLYSGFHSQGDGACFEAYINIDKWCKAHKVTKGFSKIIKAYKQGTLTAKLIHKGNYYHARMTILDWSDDINIDVSKLDELILNERLDFGNALYGALREEYDSQTSDEAVIDRLRGSEYYLTLDGKID